MSSAQKSMRLYLVTSILTAISIVSLCFTINVLVDPLWYFGGNRLTGINIGFNERLSKLIFLSKRLNRYDCLIMGSSRVTLLPERMIEGYRCYNLAFSGGTVTEFIAYAKYLKSRGFNPSLLIVGVDDFDFEDPPRLVDVPDFVREGEDPPSFLRTYASLDTLWFSIQTLLELSPLDRYYDQHLSCRLVTRVPVYVPRAMSEHLTVHLTKSAVSLFGQLRNIFPTARAIGYVPPISAWNIAQYELDGNLDEYLVALSLTAPIFDELLDFGIPSVITINPTNTYDGSHYSETVNEFIATALVNGSTGTGIKWSKNSLADISRDYRTRLKEYGLLHRRPL